MKKIFFLAILASTLFLAGCANNPFASYKQTSDQHLSKIYQGQAATAIERKDTPDVLYNMEYGLLLRINQQYELSNNYFSRAQGSMDQWANSWMSTTAGNLSTKATAYLVNDNINDYQPKGYERTFLATFYALNHVDLNNLDKARIEIKRMYELEQATQNYNDALYQKQEIASQNEKNNQTSSYLQKEIRANYNFADIGSPAVLALKNSYQNAFSHYLAGFVFEALNEPSLSRPGYVKAGQLSPTNKLIQESIDKLDEGVKPKSGTTELLIVEEVGHAPQIQSIQTSIPANFGLVSKTNCVAMINLFFPKLVPDNQNQAIYAYSLDETPMVPFPMVDVNLMAARALYDDIPYLVSRNIAAALRNMAVTLATCNQSQDKAQQQRSALLQLGTGMFSTFLDKSDERTLTLLPSKININRVNLGYGKHTLTIVVNGIKYQREIVLNQPYQILAFRIMGSQVFFNLENSMRIL